MRILFIHPNMPGQYKHLCREFGADQSNQVVFITKPRPQVSIPGVQKIEYMPSRQPAKETHRYLHGLERAVCEGQEVWRVCFRLKQQGFVPDVIVAHPGWGSALFLKDLYPEAPILSYLEFYYHSKGSDVDFDPEQQPNDDDLARIRVKNATNLLSLEQMDWGLSPTFWQWRQNPEVFQSRISVIHDGVDTDFCKPANGVSITMPNGITLSRQDEVVTYVARNFEPYRGFPTFMQAAAEILRRRPKAHIIAIGADGVSYGRAAPEGKSYRQIWSEKVPMPDPSRLHFVGTVPYDRLIEWFQISSAHIYLTYPFVLSWSFLEAMSCGALVIGSSTAPVVETITDGENGLLVDFFSPMEVADAVDRVFAHETQMRHIREAARKTIEDKYALKDLLPLHMKLVRDLAERKLPPPTAATIKKRNKKLFPKE